MINRVEKGICLSEKDILPVIEVGKITKEDIFEKFGFDYRPIVIERLRHWNNLPEGHKLKFLDRAELHEGSSGLYLLEEIVGNSWVFVQAMLENGISTEHKHEDPVIELYDPLAGQSSLNVDGVGQELNPGIPFEVLSGQVHFLKTENKPSLNLLIMKNSADIPRNKLHIPAKYK